ncbi:hypothetical protein J2Z42_001018 [Clostridium algifaecis]|uniref:Spore coat protein n=1 Tax=Clostridium algifaecis TaxID=1472040 RepID=A0ABS4KQQ1_9CLOT|nr:spore coat protein [Clostridium algifaecis]MBP2032353.1 hypothetical protein [Clostridium algifaecis]
MYYFDINSCFYKYLKSKGIVIVDDFKNEEKNDDINLPKIEEQIEVINEFHKRTLGYTGYMNKRLDNNVGKLVEEYKIYINWLKRDINNIYEKSEFQKIIKEVGKKYLEKAQKSITDIYENNYICILKRSSKRKEVGIKNTYFNNLRQRNNIEIINIDGCSYNMVEIDAISFLKKLRKKRIDIDMDYIINKFCSIENLDRDSVEFISSILNYPYEFMKCCNKYRFRSKSLDEEKYVTKLKKIVEYKN